MPTLQNQLALIADELRQKGFNIHEYDNSIYVNLGTQKVSEFEVREALGELSEAINVYSLRFGVKVMVK